MPSAIVGSVPRVSTGEYEVRAGRLVVLAGECRRPRREPSRRYGWVER